MKKLSRIDRAYLEVVFPHVKLIGREFNINTKSGIVKIHPGDVSLGGLLTSVYIADIDEHAIESKFNMKLVYKEEYTSGKWIYSAYLIEVGGLE